MIKQIHYKEKLLAIIIDSTFNKNGIEFFTPYDFSQQLAYMKLPEGHVIDPHVHIKLERTVSLTQEVLFVKSGKVRVDFYDDDKNYLESVVIKTGDVILLASGGHGFELLEESELIEVKQGPYFGENDRVRFKPKKNLPNISI